ncbi:MAG: M13 family metallopeptidase [Verrucomicrobia bacterium]|nr:M13 family metallopeptidase [Verrucomicrobiota bacterium]
MRFPLPLALLALGVSAVWAGPAFDPANMDTKTPPEKDFFRYVNGAWIDKTPIPPEYNIWGAFTELQDRNLANLRELAEAAAKQQGAAKGSIQQLVGDFYASGMDEARIEKDGATPLAADLKAIDDLKDGKQLATAIGRLRALGVEVGFLFYADQDARDTTRVVAQLEQGGLGLPDRDYYVKDDEDSKKQRDRYVDHVAKMLTLLGDKPDVADGRAKRVLALETELAKASMTRVERRDPVKTYNKMTGAEIRAALGDFSFDAYLTGTGLKDVASAVVAQPEFLKAMGRLSKAVPLDDWKQYLRWHLVHAAAPALSSAFVNEDFAFYGKALTGAKELKPRWKRIVTKSTEQIGEAIGQMYTDKYFPPAAKTRMLDLVANLRTAMAARIFKTEWMSEPTKMEAIKKLLSFTVKIGYPDKWRDYSKLNIDRGSFVQNVLRANRFEFERTMAKIDRPVDRTEWLISPPIVNAYYNPLMNEIVFPAGILQPPFFSMEADDAINYGAIGMVIGHEITHGFDDQGRQYDAVGNLRDWWTKEDGAAYDARAKLIIEQFNSYVVIDGMKVNGELTQGENIADLGGLKVAWDAFQLALGRDAAAREKKIDGFTPEQRFFLGYAQVWRQNVRPETVKLRLKTDPHSPGYLRVNGPLSNLPEFARTFNCPPGSPMVRPADQQVKIW